MVHLIKLSFFRVQNTKGLTDISEQLRPQHVERVMERSRNILSGKISGGQSTGKTRSLFAIWRRKTKLYGLQDGPTHRCRYFKLHTAKVHHTTHSPTKLRNPHRCVISTKIYIRVQVCCETCCDNMKCF